MSEDTQSVKFKPRKDKFLRARGGSSRFYNISCSNCRTWLLLYQKDGPGKLFRLYLDRIFAPRKLADLHTSATVQGTKDFTGLTCPKCRNSIAVPMVYEPESRLALRLVHGAIVKQVSDGSYPPPDFNQADAE